MMEVARVVRERAPSSWFLNFTNLAGLVTEAQRRELGDRAVGICDSPAALCARVAAALRRGAEDLVFAYAGLNHLGWLIAARDGERDLLPDLFADQGLLAGLDETRLFGSERLRRLGMIPNEYLVYYEVPYEVVAALRRAGTTRAEMLLREEERFNAAADMKDALVAWEKGQGRSLRLVHGRGVARRRQRAGGGARGRGTR